jgi:nitroimidazol reductase NimA-like FMN-containing flavoprotein (pyridoxamine 5'-phosphate oxidase superfamily)
MSNQSIIKAYIKEALQTNNLAVLASEGEGQPHACFIAITPMDDFVNLIFATYRSTRKYNNLKNNRKVAILFENRSTKSSIQPDITVLTAFGYAKEIDIAVSDTALRAHLLRHPELESFLLSPNCAIFMVEVNAYQVVRGIDDITWWHIAG